MKMAFLHPADKPGLIGLTHFLHPVGDLHRCRKFSFNPYSPFILLVLLPSTETGHQTSECAVPLQSPQRPDIASAQKRANRDDSMIMANHKEFIYRAGGKLVSIGRGETSTITFHGRFEDNGLTDIQWASRRHNVNPFSSGISDSIPTK
jgi:hypothetical protein